MFSRALIDLPDPIKIPKAPTGYGGNKPAFLKRVKIYPDLFRKELPSLILDLLTKSKFRTGIKVVKKGENYTFMNLGLKRHDKTYLEVIIKKGDLEKEIKNYVDHAIDEAIKPKDNAAAAAGKKDEDPKGETLAAMQQIDTETDEGKEKVNIEGLTKDQAELKKVLLDIKKMVDSDKWMHIAPLFGFSGAPGIRQWFMKFPEAKMKISIAARKGLPAASRIMEEINYLYDTLIKYFIDDSNIHEGKEGLISMLIKSKLSGKQFKDLSKDEQNEIKLFQQIKNDMEQLAPMLLVQNVADLQGLPKYDDLIKRTGGMVLKFLVGKIFDGIIVKNYPKWEKAAQAMLEKEGVDSATAKKLSQHLTGLKKIPDFKNLKKTAKSFISAGIDANIFFRLYEKSYAWFFSNIDNALNDEKEKALSKEIKYFEDEKNHLYKPNGKVNSASYKKISALFDEAVKNYQNALGVEIASKNIKAMLAQADAEFPELKITDVETTKEKIIKENLSSLLREYVLNVKQVN
jgi:hypothetical protein